MIYDLVPRPISEVGSTTCKSIKFTPGDIASATKGVHTVIFEWDGTNTTSTGIHPNCTSIDYELVKVTIR